MTMMMIISPLFGQLGLWALSSVVVSDVFVLLYATRAKRKRSHLYRLEHAAIVIIYPERSGLVKVMTELYL
jgi:hypothetical protein